MGKIETLIPILLFNLFFILFIIGIVLFIRQYKLKKQEHNAMIQTQQDDHKRELLATQIEIQNQTMLYIGREIHDNIGQKLTLASLYTQQLAFENKAPHINESIENISNIINESLTELRALSKSLTDDSIEYLSIYELITNECNKIIDLKKCDITFASNNPKLELPYQTKALLLRIIQEFIQNSIKHADCSKIDIAFHSKNSTVELFLKDNGKGFDLDKKYAGIGLSNMKKRAELIGGHFSMESKNNNGTSLTITLSV